MEEEAIARAVSIAGMANASVYITHISTTGGIQLIKAARSRGQVAHAEVCIHHLVLDASRYRGKRAEHFLVAPPLRSRDDVEALWSAMADGSVDTIGSDHSQLRYQPPAKNPGDFTGLPYGFAGVELRLPLLLSEGMRRGLPIQRIAQLASTKPAQIFGLSPRKGAIRPGADADLVVWDPRPEWTVKASALHDGLGESPYSGVKIRGAIRYVLMRGRLLIEDGRLVGSAARGGYLFR